MIACDFFTVDTLFLQRLYVLVFIELGSRRLHFAGCTAAPDACVGWFAHPRCFLAISSLYGEDAGTDEPASTLGGATA